MEVIPYLPFEPDLHLPADDVRAILRISRETCEMGEEFTLRAEHYLKGICKLIGAQVALFSQLQGYAPGQKWNIQPILDFGWNTKSERTTFMSFFAGDQMSDPLTPRCVYLKDSVATASRRCLVDDTVWYKSGNVKELREPAHLDDCIYSHFHLRKTGFAMGMAFHRALGDRPFSSRERLIVHLMHQHNPLYGPNFVPPAAMTAIPRRMQQVLSLLKRGFSEKETAECLRISKHTVHVYVKKLYTHFSVCSRSELLSLWVNNGHLNNPKPDMPNQLDGE